MFARLNRWCRIAVLALVPAFGVAACAPGQNQAGGTVIGALGGAAIGGALGGTRGALIGAAIGGIAGNIIGAELDAQERERFETASIETVETYTVGRVRTWEYRDPQTRRRTAGGQIRVKRQFTNSTGSTCKEVNRTVEKDGKTSSGDTVYCRDANTRSWAVAQQGATS